MTIHDPLSGGFEQPSLGAARAFRGAMEAMARPGTIRRLEGAAPPMPLSAAAGTLILTLCDPTTPLHIAGWVDAEAVRRWITFHTGAPLVPPERAAFAVGNWEALLPLGRFPAGTPDYPDRSATLIVELPFLANDGARLTGPGIATEVRLSLPEPLAPLLANAVRFPLGLDFYLACSDQIAALPRSTRIG